MQQQVMSPSARVSRLRAEVLEGEEGGPSYGSMDPGPIQAALGSQAVLINGVVGDEGQSGAVLDTTTGPVESDARRTHTTDSVTQHAPTQPNTLQSPAQRAYTAAASAAGAFSPLVDQVHQRMTVGEVAFSPPEELQGYEGERPQQPPVWIMRLGEFLQRRVTQAGAMMTPLLEARNPRSSNPTRNPLPPPPRSWSGSQPPGLFTPEAERVMQQWANQAPLLHGTQQQQQGSDSSTGSLTREQVLHEVQRQVTREMRVFSHQQSLLEAENQRLRMELERVTQDRSAQVMDLREGQGQGNLGGSQGNVALTSEEGRGDNPPGLCPQAPRRLGDPPGRQPDQRERGYDPLPGVRGSEGGQGDPGLVYQLGQAPRDAPREGLSSPLLFAENPLGAQEGQGGRPPFESRTAGDGVGGGHDSQGTNPKDQGNANPHQGGGFRSTDPLGLLVQGMAQLQNVVSESLMSKAKEPEVVKPGISELPRLPELSENSAIDVGDWLHGLQNQMGDLSNGSGLWWKAVMASLSAYYEAYARASHVGKLSLRPDDYEVVELKDPKWSRVDKRAASMLLLSVPSSVREELLASRLSGTLAILARVVVLYRPGSVVERQQVLTSLENPPQAGNAADAVVSLRRWSRWMSRATDLGIQKPDPSVLLRGLDSMCKKPLQEQPEISFRISMLRYNLEVDVRPTEKGVKDLHQALVSEFEQVAYRGSTASSSQVPFVKAVTTTSSSPPAKASSDTGSPTQHPKAKGKGATPCKYYLSEQGCSKGKACAWSHNFTRKEKQGRCWECGSSQHQQSSCPVRSEGSPVGKAKAASKSLPSAPPASLGSGGQTSTSTPSAQPMAGSPAITLQAAATSQLGGGSTGGSSEVPDVQVKQLLQEANAMLKEMRQLKMLSLSSTAVENMAVGHGANPQDGRTGLLDSGASHPFRVASQEEIDMAKRVRVQLADGGEVVLAQNRGGTLLAAAPKEGDSATPIVPLGALVQDLGCDVSWTRKRGLEIRHPEHGVIKPKVVGPCPVVGEACALDLIKELEDLKLLDLQANTAATAMAVWTWDQEKEWSQHLDSFLTSGRRASQLQALSASDSPFRWASHVDKAALAEEVELSQKAGWDYLKAFPISRQKRKRMLASEWVVHLYSGQGKRADPVLKELETNVVLVEIDITKSLSFDLTKMSGVYRGLLWGAAMGKIVGVFGAPPCRGERDLQLILKQMWLSMVAKAARSNKREFPLFCMLEGRKLFEILKGDVGQCWEPLRKIWPDFIEQMCIEEVGEVMATNLDFTLPLEITTGEAAVWTPKFKEEIVGAVGRWWKEPEALQIVKWAKKLDVKGFLESFSEKDLRMWRTHVRNNHTPYSRHCRTCVSTSGVGRIHKRIKHPSAHCLSLDVAGPFRVKAADPDHTDYRYLLVGAYTYPRLEKGQTRPKRKGAKGAQEAGAGDLVCSGDPVPAVDSSKECPQEECPSSAMPAPGGEDKPDEGAVVEPEDLLGVLLGQDVEPSGDAEDVPEGDPFEEYAEMVVDEGDDPDLKGLSQEEFEKIFHEVGEGLEFDTFYVARPLRSRTSSEVYAAVQEVFLTLRAEGLPVSRVHADRARELRTVPLRRWLLERGALCTYTEGQAPQANGRAESAVKWVKAQARKLLTATSLPKSCWAMAAVYSTWAKREAQLGRGQDVLPFGTPVHVRSKVYGTGGRYDLDLRWRAGKYVGPSLDVRGGHVVRFEDGSFLTTAHLRPHLVDSDRLIDLGKYEAMLSTPSRRVKGKTPLEEAVETDILDVDVGEHDPEHPAEQYALGLLREDHLEPEQLEILAYLLPGTSSIPKRFGVVEDAQKVWSSGAFVHGGVLGLKKSTTAFPLATRVFVKYVKQVKPEHEFTSVAINVNVQAKGHKDLHNAGNNLVIPLSAFKGGEIELDTPDGTQLLTLQDGPKVFDPSVCTPQGSGQMATGSLLWLTLFEIARSSRLRTQRCFGILVFIGPHIVVDLLCQMVLLRL